MNLRVLILVLMEDTLRVQYDNYCAACIDCLNPCFNGRYSQRAKSVLLWGVLKVLILVLMEDTLRATNITFKNNSMKCLNPCFNGRYSQSPILKMMMRILMS